MRDLQLLQLKNSRCYALSFLLTRLKGTLNYPGVFTDSTQNTTDCCSPFDRPCLVAAAALLSGWEWGGGGCGYGKGLTSLAIWEEA